MSLMITKLFRCGRVNSDGIIEVFLGSAHLRRTAAKHFISARSRTWIPQCTIRPTDQLHTARLAVRRHRGIHSDGVIYRLLPARRRTARAPAARLTDGADKADG